MPDIDLDSLRSTVTWATFAIAVVLGAAMHRSRFCTMGAVADIVTMGDWTRMRMWLFAIGVAIAGTGVLAAAGQIDPGKSLYAGPRLMWLSYVVGGLLFGFGMVLGSGCGSRTLVRIGSGSLKSVVVFVVMALFAYMTLKGVFGVARARWLDPVAVDLAAGQDLPRLLAGGDAGALATLRLWLSLAVGGALAAWALAARPFRDATPLLGSLLVGACVVAAWWVSGHLGFVAEHPDTLQEAFVGTNSGRMESFSFVAPVAYTVELLMFWSDASKVVTVGVAAVLGMIAGSAASALLDRSFRWEGFRDAEDTANHLVGGALMGVGGVTAMGCTIGQGLSGLSVLAIGSIITFAALVAGAWLGLKYQVWRFERSFA